MGPAVWARSFGPLRRGTLPLLRRPPPAAGPAPPARRRPGAACAGNLLGGRPTSEARQTSGSRLHVFTWFLPATVASYMSNSGCFLCVEGRLPNMVASYALCMAAADHGCFLSVVYGVGQRVAAYMCLSGCGNQPTIMLYQPTNHQFWQLATVVVVCLPNQPTEQKTCKTPISRG